MTFSQETLMAYADGELDAATRREIEAAMARDPQLAAQVEKHRALRGELRAAFSGVLDEPVPPSLLDTARTTPAGTQSTVTDLATARAAREQPARRHWSWPEWSAIAASLVIGVLAGRTASERSSTLVATRGAEVVASGALARALSDRPAGDVPGAQGLAIGMSFVAKSGEYCRTFTARDAEVLAGMACRVADRWHVQALSHGQPAARGGEYRMAGTALPPLILRAVEDNIAGEALDAEQEATALERGWQREQHHDPNSAQ
jgi:hypothetical protein